MRSRRIIIIVLLLAAAAAAAWYFYNQQAAANGTLSLSGTIEATEVNLPTVKGGSVRAVYAAEGDKITAGRAPGRRALGDRQQQRAHRGAVRRHRP